MGNRWQRSFMAMVFVFAVLLIGCVLSVVMPDHRDLDDRSRRGFWS